MLSKNKNEGLFRILPFRRISLQEDLVTWYAFTETEVAD